MIDGLVRLVRERRPRVLGLSGLPGCGKTTLAKALAAKVDGYVVTMSLDDFYLTKAEREARGIPMRGGVGSHDLGALVRVVRGLRAGDVPVDVPRFSHEQDDRIEPVTVERSPDLVVLDGWFLGYPNDGYGNVLSDIDLLVFIDVPIEIAKQRRFERERKLREHGGGFSPRGMERFWKEVIVPRISTLVEPAKRNADVVFRADDAG